MGHRTLLDLNAKRGAPIVSLRDAGLSVRAGAKKRCVAQLRCNQVCVGIYMVLLTACFFHFVSSVLLAFTRTWYLDLMDCGIPWISTSICETWVDQTVRIVILHYKITVFNLTISSASSSSISTLLRVAFRCSICGMQRSRPNVGSTATQRGTHLLSAPQLPPRASPVLSR